MNRSNFALFVALLIHIIFLLIFWQLGTMEFKKTPEKKEEKRIKISLKDLPPKIKKHKESGQIKKHSPKKDIPPPMLKGSQLKKLNKEFRKQTLNKTKESIKPKETIKKTQELPKKPYITLNDTNKTKEQEKKNPLYSILSQDHSSKEKKQKAKKNKLGSNIANNIKELYGSKFGKLSDAQQQYILDNQEVMRRITQQVLNRVARVNIPNDLSVNKTNVIEFYLHPNGDMTDFKFLKKSGQYILDETTKETIEYAYSRYPRPSEKTLIRYNVFYNLARY